MFIRGLTRSQKRNLKSELVVLGHMVVLSFAAVVHGWGYEWSGFAVVGIWLVVNLMIESNHKKRIYGSR